jgi:hypothetical protein
VRAPSSRDKQRRSWSEYSSPATAMSHVSRAQLLARLPMVESYQKLEQLKATPLGAMASSRV